MHKYWFWHFLFNNHCILSWLSLFFITAYPIQGQNADPGFVQDVLDNKKYINMPDNI